MRSNEILALLLLHLVVLAVFVGGLIWEAIEALLY